MITTLDKNAALILIDLQKGILQNRPPEVFAGTLANAARLVDAFHAASLPVVFVNVDPSKANWQKARKEAQMSTLNFTPEMLEIVPQLDARPADIYITKHSWGAFFETALHKELKKRNVTQIVICGVSTSIGVEGTSRQASELGYNIAFATDAMTDMVPESHERSVKYIFPRIGELDTTDKILIFLGK
jgi:nicotinamidase-related amidase